MYQNSEFGMQRRELYNVNLIPDYIYNYLTQKGIGGELLFSKFVLDERMSIDDIAVVLYLNRMFSVTDILSDKAEGSFDKNCNILLSTYDLSEELMRIKQPDQPKLTARLETASSWSYSDRIGEEVTTYLSSVCNEASSSYDFIVTGPKIWLIVKSGFITMLRNPITRLDFYRQYLKTVGEIAPLNAVHTSVFSHYVEELVG